jgi:hypothetical protein
MIFHLPFYYVSKWKDFISHATVIGSICQNFPQKAVGLTNIFASTTLFVDRLACQPTFNAAHLNVN